MTETLAFAGLSITFDERVLRPRPWTLAQSQWALEFATTAPAGPALELCSGAGHIGLAFAAASPRRIVMVDADPIACAFARHNAGLAGLSDRVEVRNGDVADALAQDERFAVVIADPPYLPSAETSRFPEDPLAAVDGGRDGLAVVRVCLDVLEGHLTDRGVAVLQLRDADQAAAVTARVAEMEGRLRAMATRVVGDGALVLLRA